jgi:hypothetical protein
LNSCGSGYAFLLQYQLSGSNVPENKYKEFYVSEIIDDLAEHMDRTDSRVRNETRQVTVLDRKDKTLCKFCYLGAWNIFNT